MVIDCCTVAFIRCCVSFLFLKRRGIYDGVNTANLGCGGRGMPGDSVCVGANCGGMSNFL